MPSIFHTQSSTLMSAVECFTSVIVAARRTLARLPTWNPLLLTETLSPTMTLKGSKQFGTLASVTSKQCRLFTMWTVCRKLMTFCFRFVSFTWWRPRPKRCKIIKLQIFKIIIKQYFEIGGWQLIGKHMEGILQKWHQGMFNLFGLNFEDLVTVKKTSLYSRLSCLVTYCQGSLFTCFCFCHFCGASKAKGHHRDHFVLHLSVIHLSLHLSCFAFAGTTCIPQNTGIHCSIVIPCQRYTIYLVPFLVFIYAC